jgi:hypothetical protein
MLFRTASVPLAQALLTDWPLIACILIWSGIRV